MSMVNLENDVKSASRLPDVHITLRSDYFQNAARGPLKYGAPGPARRILKMMISEAATEGRTRPIIYLCKLDTIFKVPELRTSLLGSPYYEFG